MGEVNLEGEVAPLPRSGTRYQVLALSGGGYRGLFGAEILAREEGATTYDQRFDLITGTSIGGIVACALAVGVRASKVRDAMLQNGLRIFPRQKWLRRLLRAPYTTESLAKAFEDAVGKPNTRLTLDKIDTPLLLPAVSETTASHHLLRSRGLAGSNASTCTLMEAALATAAAPTFFPAMRIGEEIVVDGGLIANAPDLVGVTEAMRWKDAKIEDIHVLSIGTAAADRSGLPGKVVPIGLVRWVVARGLVQLTLAAQESLAVSQCATLLGDRRYLRLDAVPSKDQQAVLALDRADQKATEALTLLAGQALKNLTASQRALLDGFLQHTRR